MKLTSRKKKYFDFGGVVNRETTPTDRRISNLGKSPHLIQARRQI